MASLSIIFRKQKIKKNKTIPVYIRVIEGRNAKFFSAGCAVEEKYWDDSEKRVKPNHPDSVVEEPVKLTT